MKIIIPKKPSTKVEHFQEIQFTAREMQEFLESGKATAVGLHKNSIALHHSQVDEDPSNFFVIKRDVVGAKSNETVVAVNPEILEIDTKSKYTHLEGCLSFPFRGDRKIPRFGRVRVKYQTPDTTCPSGLKTQEMWIEGLMAAVFQHEVEHAKGKHIYQ